MEQLYSIEEVEPQHHRYILVATLLIMTEHPGLCSMLHQHAVRAHSKTLFDHLGFGKGRLVGRTWPHAHFRRQPVYGGLVTSNFEKYHSTAGMASLMRV